MRRVTNEELKTCFDGIRTGDKRAFAAMYHEMKTPVYTVVLRIVGSREAAEDVTQELFLRLFKLPPDPSVQNLRAWIFQIARNLAIDERRKGRETAVLGDVTIPATERDLDTALDVERALTTLPLDDREVVILHLNAGLNFREIAEITGLSLPAVYRRYRRALKTLEKMLKG